MSPEKAASASVGLSVLGDPAILARPKLAMFCSVKCPGRLILGAYDFAQALRQGSWAVVGGFHSPMEKEWLRVLLRGPEALVLCVARPLEGIRVAAEWRAPMEEGRLAIVSSVSGEKRRLTAEGAQDRNRFSAALADACFVAHAAPGGKTEALCREVMGWGKPLYTLDDPANANLLEMGAKVAGPRRLPELAATPLDGSAE